MSVRRPFGAASVIETLRETLRACVGAPLWINFPHHDDQHSQRRVGFLPAEPLTARLRLCGQELEIVLASHVLASDVFLIEPTTPRNPARRARRCWHVEKALSCPP